MDESTTIGRWYWRYLRITCADGGLAIILMIGGAPQKSLPYESCFPNCCKIAIAPKTLSVDFEVAHHSARNCGVPGMTNITGVPFLNPSVPASRVTDVIPQARGNL